MNFSTGKLVHLPDRTDGKRWGQRSFHCQRSPGIRTLLFLSPFELQREINAWVMLNNRSIKQFQSPWTRILCTLESAVGKSRSIKSSNVVMNFMVIYRFSAGTIWLSLTHFWCGSCVFQIEIPFFLPHRIAAGRSRARIFKIQKTLTDNVWVLQGEKKFF